MPDKQVENVYVDMTGLMEGVKQICDDYSNTVFDLCCEAVNEVAKEGAKRVKQVGEYRNLSGKYRKSIRSKKVGQGQWRIDHLIYASGHQYSLTHLLENGHKLWQSPARRTRAFKHWAEGQDYVEDKLPEKIIEKIRTYG